MCLEGWKGRGCELPDCIDNCNDRGECDSSVDNPVCRNCDEGWMGVACEIPCNGTQVPMDSGICVCASQCQHGKSCQQVAFFFFLAFHQHFHTSSYYCEIPHLQVALGVSLSVSSTLLLCSLFFYVVFVKTCISSM